METTSYSKGSSEAANLDLDCSVGQPGNRNRQRVQTWPIVLLLAMYLLAGCADAIGSPEASIADSPNQVLRITEPQISLEPSSGTAGTFVTVTGLGWKPSAMITVRLADGNGQGNVLAAENTDENGAFSTGFLYPIGDRWTLPGSYDVVVSLQDDDAAVVKPFVFESPGDGADEAATISAPVVDTTVTVVVTATPEPDEPAAGSTYIVELPESPPLPAPPSSSPNGGQPTGRDGMFIITKNHQSLTLTCNGHSVIVLGNANTISLLDSCAGIDVRGNKNRVFYELATSITNSGNKNSIQQG